MEDVSRRASTSHTGMKSAALELETTWYRDLIMLQLFDLLSS